MFITLKGCWIQNDSELGIKRIQTIPDLQFLVLHLNKEVHPPANVQIALDFGGKLTRNLHGYYISQSEGLLGQPEKLNAVTQFEATDARFMVPCFDEPEFKATWHVELTHPTGTTALTNTDQIWVEEVADGWTVTTFGESVKMSSYLLAIFIGDLDFKETKTDSGVRVSYHCKFTIWHIPIKIRVYAPPSRINEIDYALNVSRITVDGFEKHFNIKYSMEKIDFVAVQDFAYGAMENWGLIVHGSVSCEVKFWDWTCLDSITFLGTHQQWHQLWFMSWLTSGSGT